MLTLNRLEFLLRELKKMSNENPNISQHVYGTPKFGHVSGIQVNLDLCGSGTLILVRQCCGTGAGAEPESRGAEIKLHPETGARNYELRHRPFLLPQT